MKLTKRAIQAFAYEGGWDVRWDDALPSFGARIYPTGRKAYVVSYRVQGRKRLMALGSTTALTLDQARDRAKRALMQARDGTDPLERKKADAKGNTLADLSKVYLERHAKVHKRSWRDDERRLKQHIPASWKRRRADSITAAEVEALHAEIGERAPYEANRVLALLHVMFQLAKRPQWGFLSANANNPAHGIKRFKEKKRKRWVTPEEMPRLGRAIDAEPNIYVRAALWCYLFTGARKSELLQARWGDVDWQRSTLHLPQTKSGEEQTLALSGPVMAILQGLPHAENNPYIFPGQRRGRPLVNISKPWRRVRKTAGLDDVRLHDLRRTAGSWLSEMGTDLNVIKDALRHADINTTLTYARLSADPAREAMEKHGRRLMEAAGKRVVQTRTRSS